MSQQKTTRRTTIFDPEIQSNVVRKIIVHWMFFFGCNVLALLIWVRLLEQPDANWNQTFSETLQRFFPFFVVTLALIPAFVWDTLKLTSRFTDPILRLREALADAAQGRVVPPLRFRDNDFGQEMAHTFNLVMERHQSEQDKNTSVEQTEH